MSKDIFAWENLKNKRSGLFVAGDGEIINYEEADITEFFSNLLPDDDMDYLPHLKVTIRKYPKRYYVAYEYDPNMALEENDFDYFDSFDSPSAVILPTYLWKKMTHGAYDSDPLKIMRELASHLRSCINKDPLFGYHRILEWEN